LDDYYAVLREMLGSKDNTLIAQLCLYKQMLTEFRNWRTEKESKYKMFSNTFTHPYVKAKADEFYSQEMGQTEWATPLPDAPMADLIRSLSAKYPGRYLVIDFWGMSCAPCRSAIQESKELRAEIAKRDDVKLIFIAGERTTEGSDAYKKYVAEWLADEETVCVTNDDFTRLQELFHFSGIPHYETITPDCRRVCDDLRLQGLWNFDNELKKLIERLK
jgi:thiol-disulfide isomerase/thioredoxin